MGRTVVKIVVANNADVLDAERGKLPADRVRRVELNAVVDTGAARLVLPQETVDRLGLASPSKIGVRYADHRTAQRPFVKNVWLEMQGRNGIFSAVVEPKRKDALVGAIVLEELDFLVDSTARRLLPRDPHGLFAEIE